MEQAACSLPIALRTTGKIAETHVSAIFYVGSIWPENHLTMLVKSW
jgi:hypothetical protein